VKVERLVSKMEGKTNCSRRLKQFDDPDPSPLYFTTDLRYWLMMIVTFEFLCKICHRWICIFTVGKLLQSCKGKGKGSHTWYSASS